MQYNNIWKELGISPTNDVREIKHAYAIKLKSCHPEDDQEGFQRLRQAFEYAMQQINNTHRGPTPKSPLHDITKVSPDSAFNNSPLIVENDNTPSSNHIDEDEESNTINIDKYVSALDELLNRENENQAIKYLTNLVNNELINIEKRQFFEIHLIQMLLSREDLPPGFLTHADNFFHWSDHSARTHKYRNFNLQRLRRRMQSKVKLLDLKLQVYRGTDEGKIAKLLIKPFNKWRLHWFSLSKANQVAALSYIQELQHTYPDLLYEEIDPRVVQWWQQLSVNKHITWSTFFKLAIPTFIVWVAVSPRLEKLLESSPNINIDTSDVIGGLFFLIYFCFLTTVLLLPKAKLVRTKFYQFALRHHWIFAFWLTGIVAIIELVDNSLSLTLLATTFLFIAALTGILASVRIIVYSLLFLSSILMMHGFIDYRYPDANIFQINVKQTFIGFLCGTLIFYYFYVVSPSPSRKKLRTRLSIRESKALVFIGTSISQPFRFVIASIIIIAILTAINSFH